MYENLMEQVVRPENCERALKAVESNKGAPGIDGMTTAQLKGHLAQHWEKIRGKLLAGTYQPTPVKRVEIDKPDGGTRMLGIPTVLDRFIQQLLLLVLTPIYEPLFSSSSWGFRPGRHARGAVWAAQEFARNGKDWVVDLDIEKFFDHVNHDILMTRIGQTIRDKRVLKLIGRYLRSGVMINGVVVETEEGTPQGGPLSPLLANIYLDPLDRELEKRGHSFSRYADDCNIYVGSEPAAKRVMETITEWIGAKLRLTVNASKSGIGRPWERKFLGFCLTQDGLLITASAKSLARFQARVRELWDARRSRTSQEMQEEWQSYVRGWWNYYRLAEWRRPISDLEGWIRRHIRKCFWLRWHSAKGRLRALRRLGLRGPQLKVAHSSKGAWPIAASPSLHTALSNATLRRQGFLVPSDLARAEGAYLQPLRY
jgi:group II intron reverse transcriptase/maturase